MSEWWNLDQTLIWIATKDLELVELAEGDAAGFRQRKYYYLDVPDLGVNEGNSGADTDDDEGGLGSFELLMKLLRKGKIAAVKADDETGTPLSKAFFNDLAIGPHETGPALVFRPPGNRLIAGVVREREAVPILLSSNDLLRWVPAKVPDSLQDELAALVTRPSITEQETSKEPQRRLSPERLRAIAIVKERYPNGLPRRSDGYGAQAKAIRAVKDQMIAEGWPKEKVKGLDETIRRAGGAKPG